MMTWRNFVARTATAAALFGVAMTGAVFVGMRLAKADPGGATRDELTFSGVLRDPDGSLVNRTLSLNFVFHKAGSSATCTPTAMATAVNGAFTASVSTSACPRGFFDGADVTYDVLEGTTPLAMGVNVTPVPYARYADQAGVGSDCPAGYTRDVMQTPGIVCVRTVVLGGMQIPDQVVKVGTGSTAFWIDRFEAAAHAVSSGNQVGTATSPAGAADDIPAAGLPRNGQRPSSVPSPVQALSHPAVGAFTGFPTANITWFQANEACRAAGKRLPTGSEWLAAASGTTDGAACNVSTSASRAAAVTNSCVSASGAHDMIGNVWEWTDEWFAGAGNATMRVNPGTPYWPTDYNADGTWNINGAVNNGVSDNVIGLPAAALRGGVWDDGARAGVFALHLGTAPSGWGTPNGFRCVVLR